MPHPKYEIGEVVLLRSVELPHMNCEAAVLKIYGGPAGTKIDHEGVGYQLSVGGFSYFLDKDFPSPETGNQIMWAESALRKKHQPGEMGFEDLMFSLSSPKLLTLQPDGVVAAPPL